MDDSLFVNSKLYDSFCYYSSFDNSTRKSSFFISTNEI